jgi:hypothetical protein
MQGISFVDFFNPLWHTYYMEPIKDLSRFKKMRRGDIWLDKDGDYILIKSVYRGWEKDKKTVKWVCIDAILMSANAQFFIDEGYYPGQLIEDYRPDCIVRKLA